MMKKAALLLPLMLAACFPIVLPVSNPLDAAPNVYGQWRISEVSAQHPSPDGIFTVNSSNSGFSVSSDCVEIRGVYALGANNAITFSNVQGKDKNCDAAQTAERQLSVVLPTVRSYRFNNRDLVLVNEAGSAVFVGRRFSQERAVGQADTKEAAVLKDARRK